MAQSRILLKENDRSHLQPFGEKITVTWTADGSGNFSVSLEDIRGFLVKLKTGPGGTPPTAYDLKIFEATTGEQITGVDELSGICSGANARSATDDEQLPVAGSGVSLLTYFNGNYTATITGAGAGGQGIFELYVKNR